MHTIVLQGTSLTSHDAETIAARLNGTAVMRQGYARITTERPVEPDTIQSLRSNARYDINILPAHFNPQHVKLLITDMDSTFINIECIDEIADFCGLKQEVAAITEAAMRGELDFAQSLTKRVGLLNGLDAQTLHTVYEQRLSLNPGGEKMLYGLHKAGINVALVSGGFTFFTDRLKTRYQLFATRANTLEINDGKLSGRVLGDIVGAEAKAAFLHELCQQEGLSTTQVVAMGDGANDLKMLKQAGLSIAYHAKPTVQAATHTALNFSGLEGVLGLLDISVE